MSGLDLASVYPAASPLEGYRVWLTLLWSVLCLLAWRPGHSRSARTLRETRCCSFWVEHSALGWHSQGRRRNPENTWPWLPRRASQSGEHLRCLPRALWELEGLWLALPPSRELHLVLLPPSEHSAPWAPQLSAPFPKCACGGVSVRVCFQAVLAALCSLQLSLPCPRGWCAPWPCGPLQGRFRAVYARAHLHSVPGAQPTLGVPSVSLVPLASRGSFSLPALRAHTLWGGLGVILGNPNWPPLVLTQAPGQAERGCAVAGLTGGGPGSPPAQCSALSHRQRRRMLCFCELGVSLPITVEVARGGGHGEVEGTGGFFWIAMRTRAGAVEALPEALGRDPVTWALGLESQVPGPGHASLPFLRMPSLVSKQCGARPVRVLRAQRTGKGGLEAG